MEQNILFPYLGRRYTFLRFGEDPLREYEKRVQVPCIVWNFTSFCLAQILNIELERYTLFADRSKGNEHDIVKVTGLA
jgi:hypothetical protein